MTPAPIDIAELRRRIDRCTWKGPECSVFVTQATLAALLDEVERLRGERKECLVRLESALSLVDGDSYNVEDDWGFLFEHTKETESPPSADPGSASSSH